MIEVRTAEQLSRAIQRLRENHQRGLGTMALIRSLGIDPISELRGRDWRSTDFSSADLRGADLSDCRLAFCDFTNADVAGAVFHNSDLFRSTIHRALNLSSAFLSEKQRDYIEECRNFDAESGSHRARLFRINQEISAASSFEEAKALFRSIAAAGLHPDQYSAGLLTGRASNSEEADEAFDIVQRSGCPFNEVIFTVLASKMRTAAEVRRVMELMHDEGVAPGARIYNTLLSRTKEDPNDVLAEMREAEIPWDHVTLDIMMRRATFAEGKILLLRLIREGLRPRSAEVGILMRLTESESDADEARALIDDHHLACDAETYGVLAAYKARQADFEGLLEDMEEDEINPDLHFFRIAIGRSRNFSDGCFLFGRMNALGVEPDEQIYGALAYRAGVPLEELDPGRRNWPQEAIVSLIRRKGSAEDTIVAGLHPTE